ncbi:MAG: hypothetical protein J2P19_29320, partial [Pseudonocardia sp.]|nr:hypothetical protein [Pseudonocardia sp.]
MIAVLLVVGLALVIGLRRRACERRNHARGRHKLARVAVVAGLVAVFGLIGAPAYAAPFDCKEAPEPDRPGSGLVGSLDPAVNVGEPHSVYNEVGYAGLVWHNYDLGCGGSVTDPSATTDTWLGNQTFNLAKFAVGGVNW